ncbi:MAG TPA: hypothetical protein VMI31_04355 [Fimbriimonadaceae bacterium]|nr:hypothetical protein [Fimbriimonadaceae bacterium]
MAGFCSEFVGDGGASVVIEANAQTVYAYFLVGGRITGDVWLFNRQQAPENAPWEHGGEPPFMNARRFALECLDAAAVTPGDFRVMFRPEDTGKKAAIYLRDRLVAIVWDGCAPGKSAFARETSPVAVAFGDVPKARQVPSREPAG